MLKFTKQLVMTAIKLLLVHAGL